MKLKVIDTGSKGNCYALEDSAGNILLLDVGIGYKQILSGIGYRVSAVCGVLATHSHTDHCQSVKHFDWGVPVIMPWQADFEHKKCIQLNGGYTVQWFPLTDMNGCWTHTNTDGTDCPCYGYYITHPELKGVFLYITDTQFVKWRFKGVTDILLGVDYSENYVSSLDYKYEHQVNGHMSIGTAVEFLKSNADTLQNVILCHLSNSCADVEEFINESQKAVKCPVNIAKKGMLIEL